MLQLKINFIKYLTFIKKQNFILNKKLKYLTINKNSNNSIKLIKNYLLNKKKNKNLIQLNKIELNLQKLFNLNNAENLYTFFTVYKILTKK